MGIMVNEIYAKAAAIVREWNRRQPLDMGTFEEGVLRHALTNRDWAHIQLQALDVEAQLLAIEPFAKFGIEHDVGVAKVMVC